MFIIAAAALAAFQSSELSQLLHVWPIQKEHIVVPYNLALRDMPLFEQTTLYLQLTIFRTLSGATALPVGVGDKRP